MNLIARITTWWVMFGHQLRMLRRGEYHIEECITRGPKILGVYIGIKFISRRCHTCSQIAKAIHLGKP